MAKEVTRGTAMNLRGMTQRAKKDEELAEEIESHLAHEEDANAARGLSAEEARRRARVRFGNPRATRERVWLDRSFPWMETFCAICDSHGAR